MTSQTFPDQDEDVSDLEALSVTREESRAILDRKLEMLDQINAKAMHTVRTAVVVLGLVISGLALIQKNRPIQLTTASIVVAGVGTLCLLLAIVTGIATYSMAGVPDGVSRAYRDDVREGGYDEENWLLVLLGGYDQWVDGISQAIQRKGRRLLWAQLLLAVGLVLVVIGVALYSSAL